MKRNRKCGPGPDFSEVSSWRQALSRASLGPLDGEVAAALSLLLLAVLVSPRAARSEGPPKAAMAGAPVLAGLVEPSLVGPSVPFDGAWRGGGARRDGFTVIVPPELDAAMVVPVDPNLDAEMVVRRDGNGRAVRAWPDGGPSLAAPPGWAAPPGQSRTPMPGPWWIVPPTPGPWRNAPPMIKPR